MRIFIFIASLSIAVLYAGADSAPAAGHGGGGHGGGGFHGGGYHGGYYGRGFYGGGFYGGFYPGFYGGYGYGYGYGAGAGLGLAAPYYYGAPGAGVYMGAGVPYGAPGAGMPYGAPGGPPGGPGTSATGAATIRVLVPDAQATVQVDGQTTRSTGTDRVFQTPPLTPGGTYNYTIRAIWNQGGRQVSSEKTVPVAPGQTTVLDFTQPAAEKAPPPIPIKPGSY